MLTKEGEPECFQEACKVEVVKECKKIVEKEMEFLLKKMGISKSHIRKKHLTE